jgi:hypothetical protein
MWLDETPNEAPNAWFLIEDINSEDYKEDEEIYDYVHGRGLSGSIQDWPGLIGKCYKLASILNYKIPANASIGRSSQMDWLSFPDPILVSHHFVFQTNYYVSGPIY